MPPCALLFFCVGLNGIDQASQSHLLYGAGNYVDIVTHSFKHLLYSLFNDNQLMEFID